MPAAVQPRGEDVMDEELLRWMSKVVPWDEIYYWWRCCEDCWNDNKGLRILHQLSWCSSRGLWVLTLILKELLWVKCSQVAFPATEKSFMKRRVNLCSIFHCCLILRNCHCHPSLQQSPPWGIGSHQHQGKALHQQRLRFFESSDDD